MYVQCIYINKMKVDKVSEKPLEFSLYKRNYGYLGGMGKIGLASMLQRPLVDFGEYEKKKFPYIY